MKTLIIAGVQKSKGRSITWGYLERLNAFLRDRAYCYDKILLIAEPEIAYPNFKLLNIKTVDKLTILKIVNSFEGSEVPTFLRYYLTHDPLAELFTKNLYVRMKETGILPESDFITLSEEGNNEVYYSPILKELFDTAKTSNEICIIGRSKEVSLLQDLFSYHHKETRTNKDFCFDSTTVVTKEENIISSEPSQEVKTLLTSYLDKSLFSKLEID